MKIYKINTTQKNDGYEAFYELLKSLGEFSIYFGNIVLLSEKELPELEDIINKNDKLLLSEVNNIEEEINNKFVVDWVKEQQFKDRSAKAQVEVQNKINAMCDIISTAKKIYKEGGGVKKDVEEKKSKKK